MYSSSLVKMPILTLQWQHTTDRRRMVCRANSDEASRKLNANITALKADVVGLKADVAIVRAEVLTIRRAIRVISITTQGALKSVPGEYNRTKQKYQDKVAEELKIFNTSLHGFKKELKEDIESVKEEVKFMKEDFKRDVQKLNLSIALAFVGVYTMLLAGTEIRGVLNFLFNVFLGKF